MSEDEKLSFDKSIGGISGKKIMVVEDDDFLRDIIARKLSRQGCSLVYAHDGEKALEMVEREMPDIILLDILLPGINGFDLLEKFKLNPIIQHIPVILFSNLSQESDIEKGKKLKASRFLVKATVSLDEVIQQIKEVLEETKMK